MNFKNKPKHVAKELIGRTIEPDGLVAEIIETEPYKGGNQTERRHCMMLAPGQIGIMPYRRLSFINIGTEAPGVPSCVLIRAVRIDDVLYDGPGRVGKVLKARNLEYKMMGEDIPVKGQTKPSDFYIPKDKADNSQGRYRLKGI